MAELEWLISRLPNFVRYVALGFGLVALFIGTYAAITPWREITLIRAGNSAAAVALAGALLGFCLPLANTIAHSSSLTDVVLWALVALVVQVAVHIALRFTMPYLKQAIETNESASGIAAAGFSLSFGLINASCLTY